MAERLAAFGVKNLRCLTDTGLVPIKPLTLLVGRNSSGKSTFLRAFPLLRQSVQNPRRSPILWSHQNYVDFGSLDIAVNERARDRGVTFSFAADMDDGPFIGKPRCELSMTIAAFEGGAYLRSYDLVLEGRTVQMVFEPGRRMKSLMIDGHDALPSHGLWLAGPASLIPSIDPSEEARLAYLPFVGRFTEPGWRASPLTGSLLATLKSQYGLSDDDAHTVALVFAVPDGDLNAMAARLHGALVEKGIEPSTIDPASESFRMLANTALLARLPEILAAFDRVVADFASRVAYLGPRRAVGERQYQNSEIAVDEIFPRGENLPQFLASLGEGEMADLADFTREYLGFEPALRQQGLNIEILIKQPGASEYQNIADVGFGYAQLLPICASVWLNMFKGGSLPSTSVLVLEEPELHLHPRHQTSLARMLAVAVKNSRKQEHGPSLVVETHSEALVNGLGMLVRGKQIRAEDIQIVVFDQKHATHETVIRFAAYKENGALRDGPFDSGDWDSLAQTAEAYSGYFTRHDARAAKYNDIALEALAREGRVEACSSDVFRVIPYPPSEHEDLILLWLQTDRKAVFSHETALALHDLSDILPTRRHIIVPDDWDVHSRRLPIDVVIHRAAVPEADITWRGGVPVTRPARTVNDCVAASVPDEIIDQAMAEGIERALFVANEIQRPPRAESA